MYPLSEGSEKNQWLSYVLIGGFLFVVGFFVLLYLVDNGYIQWDLGQFILNSIG